MTIGEQERIYFIGGTGNTGAPAVKELLKKKIPVTLYARSPEKAQNLFSSLVAKDDISSLLTIVQGDLEDLTPFEESIQGHTRLFLVAVDFQNYAKKVIGIAEKAYAAGIKQVVHISSMSVSHSWRVSFIGSMHRVAEESVLAIPDRGSYVALRPSRFMSNNILFDRLSIQHSNVIVDTAKPDARQEWISNNDIGTVAANIFQDPVEKHGDAVYELIGDLVTPETRAKYLSQSLGKPIRYVKQTVEERYTVLTKQVGLPHGPAFDLMQSREESSNVSSGISLLLGRQPETLEQWIEENKNNFL
ncbi:hypothetical protein BDC45DRAFT_456922 [Circinella umbellata]|nr:hypothetical protein BDC45DRAFT_456922 [Circinella umbellata]